MNIPIVTRDFENFDFSKYDSSKETNSYLSADGTFSEWDKQSYGYISRTTPGNSYFIIIKKFYKEGGIKEKGLLFNSGGFKKGIWYYFNDQGKLIKEEDNDQAYKFSFPKLYAFLKTQKIALTPGHVDEGYHTHIYNKTDEQGAKWIVQWLKDTNRMPNFIEEMIIDGQSGKVLNKKIIEYINN